MDIIEKIISNVEKTTKVVVQKSTDMVELTKLKLAISNAEGDARDIMYDVGKLVYNAYRGGEGNSELIEEKCKRLDELRAEINEKRSEYARLRNMKHCPECDKENDADALFCSKCGAKLPEFEAYETDVMPGESQKDEVVIDADD